MKKLTLLISTFGALLALGSSCPDDDSNGGGGKGQTKPTWVLNEQAPEYFWVQLGPNGTRSARAIVKADCPLVSFDGKTQVQMKERAPAAPAAEGDFPRSCEVNVPKGSDTAIIAYKMEQKDPSQPAEGPAGRVMTIQLPSENSGNVAILGDSGCDNHGLLGQNCSSSSSWPFKEVVDRVVGSAQKNGISLVIHVGDYVYRGDELHRDVWSVWEKDLFEPARNVFAVAPMLWVRGNHEQCKEAHKGWFRYLDPYPYNASFCPQKNSKPQDGLVSPTFAVQLGNLKMVILDSSAATDKNPSTEIVDLFKNELVNAAQLATDKSWQDVWLLTHRVVWGCAPTPGGLTCDASGEALRKGWQNAFEDRQTPFTKVLSGHIHLFSATDFNDDKPMQIIVGNSGASLNSTRTFGALADVARETGKSKQQNIHGPVFLIDKGNDLWNLEMRNASFNLLLNSLNLSGNKITQIVK